MGNVEELKILIREKDFPYFSDEELNYFLNKYSDIKIAAYLQIRRH